MKGWLGLRGQQTIVHFRNAPENSEENFKMDLFEPAIRLLARGDSNPEQRAIFVCASTYLAALEKWHVTYAVYLGGIEVRAINTDRALKDIDFSIRNVSVCLGTHTHADLKQFVQPQKRVTVYYTVYLSTGLIRALVFTQDL
jgi:hypothetical protein